MLFRSAYGKGGVLETVIDGETGVFFKEQTVESMIEAIKKAKKIEFQKEKLREHAMEFDEEVFRNRLKRFVEEQYKKFEKKETEGIEVYR